MPRLVALTGSSVKVVVRDGAGAGDAAGSDLSAVSGGPPAVVPSVGPTGDEETAAGLVEAAAARAEAIVARARGEAAAIEQEAYQKGLALGREEGRREAAEEGRTIIEEARRILEAARAEREEIIREARPEILRLAVATARKIVREAAEGDSEMAVRAALEAVRKVRDEEELTVRANPRDVVELEERRQELRAAARGAKRLIIAEDPTIEPGGCVIDTPRGSIDARLERQLARAEKALLDVMKSEN